MKIGQKVYKVRELRGYSQEYMGLRLGICQTTYSKIERSGREIARERLARIAQILEVELSLFSEFDVNAIFCRNSGTLQWGLADVERQYYESKIQSLQGEITFLRNLPPPHYVTHLQCQYYRTRSSSL